MDKNKLETYKQTKSIRLSHPKSVDASPLRRIKIYKELGQ